MIETVIFDMDDTLYDEIDYCRGGFESVAEFLAGQQDSPTAGEIFEALWQEFVGGNRKETFNAALEQLNIGYDENFIGKLVKIYREHQPKITLPTESREVLEQLKDKYRLALITDGFLPAQKLKVRALEIEKYFETIVYTEELGREYWKPSTVGFEKIIEKLEIKAENTAYTGDNEKKDFLPANKLGIASIQLLRPARIHTQRNPQPNSEALHVIGTIADLPALLEKL